MNLSLRKGREGGTILFVVMALLAMMCVFMLGTTGALVSLKKELKLIEKKQVERYDRRNPAAARRNE